MIKDLSAMTRWFQTGRYVADTTLQKQFFGALPAAEDTVRRLITGLGHSVRG
jgi:hypothetical protein